MTGSSRKTIFRPIGSFGSLRGLREFDSDLERKVLENLAERGVSVTKNPNSKAGVSLEYSLPVKRYVPDVILPNGVHLEIKGPFDPEDRLKIKCVKEQHPGIDLRIAFQNPKSKISKGSKTSYADWCDKHGIPWAKWSEIPDDWLK